MAWRRAKAILFVLIVAASTLYQVDLLPRTDENTPSTEVHALANPTSLPLPLDPGEEGSVAPGRFSGKIGTPERLIRLTFQNSSIMCGTTGDLEFLIKITRSDVRAVEVFIPPEFGISPGTVQNVWTNVTNNYRFMSLGKVSRRDVGFSLAPGWWIARVRSPFAGELAPRDSQVILRLFNVSAPTILGRYFFKITLDGLPIRATDFPTLVVKCDLNPAFISGTVRIGGQETSLFGQPISLLLPDGTGGRVVAFGRSIRGEPISAQAYFNKTSNGEYTIFGLPPGTYNLTAQAAGFPPQPLRKAVSVQASQSVEGVDIFLFRGPTITGTVFSKCVNRLTPWGKSFPISPFAPFSRFPRDRPMAVDLLDAASGALVATTTPFLDNLFTNSNATEFTFKLHEQAGYSGHIPQVRANFTSGIPPGDYQLRVYVEQYVQLEETKIRIQDRTRQFITTDIVDVKMDLWKNNPIVVTMQFKNQTNLLKTTPTPRQLAVVLLTTDVGGNMKGWNITVAPKGTEVLTMEATGFSGLFPTRGIRDQGLRPGTYLLRAYISGWLEPNIPSVNVGICTQEVQPSFVSFDLFRGAVLNITAVSVNATSGVRPSIPVNYAYPRSNITLTVFDEGGRDFGFNRTVQPVGTSFLKYTFDGMDFFQLVFRRNIFPYFFGLLDQALDVGSYVFRVRTLGYLDEGPYKVFLIPGTITDVSIRLFIGPIIDLTLNFQTENVFAIIGRTTRDYSIFSPRVPSSPLGVAIAPPSPPCPASIANRIIVTESGRGTIVREIGRGIVRTESGGGILSAILQPPVLQPPSGPDPRAVLLTFPQGAAPSGVAIDTTCTIFVTEIGSNVVSRITGCATLPCTTREILFSQFPVGASPFGIAIEPGGTLIVTEPGSNLISRITNPATPPGSRTVLLNASLVTPFPKDAQPTGVAIIPAGAPCPSPFAPGDIIVAEQGSDVLSRLSPASSTIVTRSIIFSFSRGTKPSGIVIDPSSCTFVVTESGKNLLSRISPPFFTRTVIAYLPQGTNPNGLAILPTNTYLFIAETGRDLLSRVTNPPFFPPTPAGSGVRSVAFNFGSEFGKTGVAVVPNSAACTGAGLSPGDLIVTEFSTNMLSRITRGGTRSVIFTFLTGTGPSGVAIDDNCNFIVAETGTDTLSRVSPPGGRAALSSAALFPAVLAPGAGPVGVTFSSCAVVAPTINVGDIVFTTFGQNRLFRLPAGGPFPVAPTLLFNFLVPVPSGVNPNGVAPLTSDGTCGFVIAEANTNSTSRVLPAIGTRFVIGASYARPYGVAVTSAQELIVSEPPTNNLTKTIMRSPTTGDFTGVRKSVIFPFATRTDPSGIALDGQDIIVAEAGANVISKVVPTGGTPAGDRIIIFICPEPKGIPATSIRVEVFDKAGKFIAANLTLIPTGAFTFKLPIIGFDSYAGSSPAFRWYNFFDSTDGAFQLDFGIQPGTYLLRVIVPRFWQSQPIEVTLFLGTRTNVFLSMQKMARVFGLVKGPDILKNLIPLSWARVGPDIPVIREIIAAPSLEGFYETWVVAGTYIFGANYPGYKAEAQGVTVTFGADNGLSFFMALGAPPRAAVPEVQSPPFVLVASLVLAFLILRYASKPVKHNNAGRHSRNRGPSGQ